MLSATPAFTSRGPHLLLMGARTPASTARCAAEIADTLGERLPRRRANRLANRYRAAMLLDLMTADLRRPSDELAWATKIRRYLEGRSGVVPLGQRSNDDPAGVASLRA